MNYFRNCPICNTRYDTVKEEEICPYCEWFCLLEDYSGFEDDKEMGNPITYRQAKELLSKGLNIWGNPLPKKNNK